MILVLQLNQRSPELSKVVVNDIGQLIACKDCLLLHDADISPRLNKS